MIVKNIGTFAENKTLIKQIESNIKSLWKEFDNLKELLKSKVSDGNFNIAINSFYQIFQLIPLLAPHLDSYELPFFRARPNDKKNVLFTKITEISYNSSNVKAIKAGRFNQPMQAVFYASLPVDNGDINSSMVACPETCKGLTDPDYPVTLKDFTISRWKIIKPFYVINFCFDEEHLKINPSLKRQTEEYMKAIRAYLNKESSDFIFEFLTYFSEMSGRRSPEKNEYYILTAMFYAMRYYYKKASGLEVHGLIYPSAMSEKKGLNIVLMTNAVDQFLKPEKLAMYRFILQDKTFHADPCSHAIDLKGNNFTITGYRRIPENKYYTIECESDNGPLEQSRD